MVTTSQSIPKESKVLISYLDKFGTETKLQSFNSKGILKDPGILRKGLFLTKINFFTLKMSCRYLSTIGDYAKDGGPGVPGLLCGFYHEPLRSLIVKKVQ